MSDTSGVIASDIKIKHASSYDIFHVMQVDPAPLSVVLRQVPRLRDAQLPLALPQLLGH